MNINTKSTNKILLTIGIAIIVGALIWSISLNEAQRIVVIVGATLGIVNLLALSYFFNKNTNRRNRIRKR